jgi:fermentation-respiration switch protein FrsA (DUF1100 family)
MLYIILGIILIVGYVKYIEMRGIYYPIKNLEFTPANINLKFEDVYFKTIDNLKLNAWFIPHPEAKYTLLFFHGNAGNLQDRLDKINMLHNLGLNIFILDYRGYGKSEGKPSEKGLYKDAQAAYSYLVNVRKILPDEIILYGESLGTAVAIDLAAKFKVKALILEGAFSCGRDMAKTIYPYLPNFIFTNSFNSLEKIKKISTAKLFLHSQEDEIVPNKLTKKLFASACLPKYFIELKGSHNNAFLDDKEQYLSAIASFLTKL